MKRKIAVFGNAWSMKTLSDALVGIKECAKEKDMDVFAFLSHAAPGNAEDEMREEKRIYQLPDLADFDAAIVFSASMNFTDLVLNIRDRAVQAGIPAVSVGIKIDGMSYVGADQMDGMYNLVEHLVTEHQVRTIKFMAGPKGHEHSELRIEATRKVFEKHGIPFHEESIFYSDWSAAVAAAEIRRILTDENESLPDAIICANDTLAMPVCLQIEKFGYKVPDDVIVTGFDDSYDGQVFYPALCTVGQSNYELGKCAFQSAWEAIQGEAMEEALLKSYFVPNESCGCHSDKTDASRREVCRKYYPDKVEDIRFGWGNKWLTEMFLNADNISQIKTNLNDYLKKSDNFYRTSYFLQDMIAGEYLKGEEIDKDCPGYSEELKVWASVNNGKVVPCDKILRRELIPGYKKEEGVTHMYMFLPLHFETRIFGYLVLDDWMEGIESGKIKVFMDSLNMTLDKLKQNLVLESLNARLRDLYTRDSLTGLYNRFGFEAEGIQVFNDCKKRRKPMVLMFTDINRMKVINDYYGHLQGDVAIKTVAEAIKRSIPKHWLAIRFGGDEFLVVGQCDDENEILSVKANITENAQETSRKMSYPFYLSISCGYMHFIPEGERTLDSYIMNVDEKMYDIKADMHKNDAELRAFVDRCKKSRFN